MSTEQENYQKLQAERLRDSKKQMRQTQGKAGEEKVTDPNSANMANRSRVGRALNVSREAKLAKELPLAFTAVDPSEDAIHWLIIIFSLIGDLTTIIPFVGSFIALPFIILVWVLYFINNHFKRSSARKVLITGGLQMMEITFSSLPALSASAFINYWFYLADKKLEAKERQDKQQQQEINF